LSPALKANRRPVAGKFRICFSDFRYRGFDIIYTRLLAFEFADYESQRKLSADVFAAAEFLGLRGLLRQFPPISVVLFILMRLSMQCQVTVVRQLAVPAA
jgi:hypothetical protein